MREFYEILENANPNHQNIVMTVIDGDDFGQKALVSNRELLWESEELGFFSSNKDKIESIGEGGVAEIDGQKVYCELIGREKKMVICGAGHVSIPIIRMGKMIGLKVTVIDDRPSFANDARRAEADEVFCDSFDHALDQIPGDADTFFIIVTRGHRYDQACLQKIAMKAHAYIGMIGSKRRVAMVKKLLIEDGIPKENLDDIYAPIGLSIGAQTPEEIAVAILAQVIEVKNKQKRSGGYPSEIMDGILYSEDKNPKALVTIVTRHGSAPREAGTKMLISSNGTSIGSIGGGCAEANVFQKAILKLHTGDYTSRMIHVDMSHNEAEDEGMVCGGQIDVLIEVIA